jgi:hypothetical protein
MSETPTRKRVAITGASGLIGRNLQELLRGRECEVIRMVRSPGQAEADDAVYWSADDEEIDLEGLEGVDIVVHLAGENIFGRWTEAKKRRIMESRRKGTRLIADACANLDKTPEALISMSGSDYYPDSGDEWLEETDPAGEGFLAEVCKVWEGETEPAKEAGVRTVNCRMGIVFSKEGGALKTMLTPFKMGVGGRIGSGEQYMSWIDIEDAVRAIGFCALDTEMEGPVNVCTPNPVTNQELTDMLGELLHRPTVIPVPKFAAKLALGQMAEEALLTSQRMRPKRLEEAGFEWRYPALEEALRHELGVGK